MIIIFTNKSSATLAQRYPCLCACVWYLVDDKESWKVHVWIWALDKTEAYTRLSMYSTYILNENETHEKHFHYAYKYQLL